jgi:PKD repeat protein
MCPLSTLATLYSNVPNVSRTSSRLVRLLAFGLFFQVSIWNAHAAEVTLVWDTKTDPELGGYQLYYGQYSRNYAGSVRVGNQTTYTLAGLEAGKTYYFAVTAYDRLGQTESAFSNEVQVTIPFTVVPPLVASFNASPTTGTAPLKTTFTNNSSGNVTAWTWNFGDGTTSTAKNPIHTYSASGTYSVSLTVTGPGGSKTVTKTSYIAVLAPAPVATAPVAGFTTTYEDAEDGNTSGWAVYDNTPSGARIINVFDPDRQSRVIQFMGSGTQNGYRLGNANGATWSAWHNSDQFVVEWSMKYSENFIVYIDVQTTAGHRYLYYTPTDQDGLGSTEYVHHGLGTAAMDGQWHTFVRDLQADLADAQPGVMILEVNGFLIRGTGQVDDVQLNSNSVTPYEDAEDGNTSGWGVYDNTPSGARITNIFDPDRQSRVIQFMGSGIQNGYRLGNATGTTWSQWHNSDQSVVEWSMEYSENFVVYIDVQTTTGHRYLYYTPVNQDGLGGAEYVHHGLGTAAMDGQWHTFVRDLQADLADAQPGVMILEVNGFLIRGSGKVDDVKLRNY